MRLTLAVVTTETPGDHVTRRSHYADTEGVKSLVVYQGFTEHVPGLNILPRRLDVHQVCWPHSPQPERGATMEYATWYDFKRDCESQLGRMLPNHTWLLLKPRRPLPWDSRDLRTVVPAAQMTETVRPRKPKLASTR